MRPNPDIFFTETFSSVEKELVFLLSICFATSYYCVLQVENIMWMDGVYMLPLMMYGVWRLVKQKKGEHLLPRFLLRFYSTGTQPI